MFGSRYFAAALKNSGKNINYMLNLDMIGQLRSQKGLIVYGTGTSPAWNKALRKNYSLPYKMIRVRSGLGGSDHMSFYNEGIPDIFLFTGTHDKYHRPGDDPNTLNYTGAAGIVKFAEELITYLDDKGQLGFRRTSLWSAFWGALRTM